MAGRLCTVEGGDRFVVEMAALLHDLDDYKLNRSEQKTFSKAKSWMEKEGIEDGIQRHIMEIIHGLSFKGLAVPTPMRTPEGKIVQDADRLDAMGAIGIARAFSYGGSMGRALHDPSRSPKVHTSFESYQKEDGPTINHFYEKLLHLKERMNTTIGRAIAEKRHAFMVDFLNHFLMEWEGGDGPRNSASQPQENTL